MKSQHSILVLFFLIGIVVLSGCSTQDNKKLSSSDYQKSMLCNEPYIQKGTECCLDQDNNKICDDDENTFQVEDPFEVLGIDNYTRDLTHPRLLEFRIKVNQKLEELKINFICDDEKGNHYLLGIPDRTERSSFYFFPDRTWVENRYLSGRFIGQLGIGNLADYLSIIDTEKEGFFVFYDVPKGMYSDEELGLYFMIGKPAIYREDINLDCSITIESKAPSKSFSKHLSMKYISPFKNE